MAPSFHELTIIAVRKPSANSTALVFEIPPDLKDEFSFDPGQYLTLRTTIDGNEVRRSYSICSARSRSELAVGIKQVEDGLFSNHVLSLKPGDKLNVMEPQGRFTAPLGGNHDYLLIAAGSGITPCLSIARSVLEEEAQSSITLLYGNRTSSTVMFLNEINALKDQHTERFQLIHILSREQSEPEFLNGHIDEKTIATLSDKKLIDISRYDAAYLCGPQDMIKSCTSGLLDHGMEENRILFELFGTTQHKGAWKKAKANPANRAENAVSIILDGKRNTVPIDPKSETVLAAAQHAGMDLPFSCEGGMCCTCRCKILEGSATMDVNYSLQKWEVEAGFTLACQSRPSSKHLVLDFDAK